MNPRRTPDNSTPEGRQEEDANGDSPGREGMEKEEIVLTCSDGIRLAGQLHRCVSGLNDDGGAGDDDDRMIETVRVLCLHGWMDNARSFHYLAPEIAASVSRRVADTKDKGNGNNAPSDEESAKTVRVEVVSIDFPGHGRSDHRSVDGPLTVMPEFVYYIYEALHQLKWIPYGADPGRGGTSANHIGDDVDEKDKVIIVAHSMGTAAGLMYASSFPDHTRMLVMMEGAISPFIKHPRDVANHIRSHVQRRHVGNRRLGPESSNKHPKTYPTLQHAVEARRLAAKAFPGNQWLSREASEIMVCRGTRPVGGDDDEVDDAWDGPVQFRHDPRLQLPAVMFFSNEQAEALCQEVKCPSAVFLAKNGWPTPNRETLPSPFNGGGDKDDDKQEQKQQEQQPVEPVKKNNRFDHFIEVLGPATVRTDLPGSHHFHADPDTAPIVADCVVDFIVGQLTA